MGKPIIRVEVQATPTIDMFGVNMYPWRIVQITDGCLISLRSGFERSRVRAYDVVEQNLKQII